MADLEQRLTEIFREVFGEDDLTISREMTAADVAGWTSVAHVEMILQVELAFDVRLNTGEITGLRNVGELMDLIEQRLAD